MASLFVARTGVLLPITEKNFEENKNEIIDALHNTIINDSLCLLNIPDARIFLTLFLFSTKQNIFAIYRSLLS